MTNQKFICGMIASGHGSNWGKPDKRVIWSTDAAAAEAAPALVASCLYRGQLWWVGALLGLMRGTILAHTESDFQMTEWRLLELPESMITTVHEAHCRTRKMELQTT